MAAAPSNAELKIILEGLREHAQENDIRIIEKLTAVDTKVTLINGRVRKLEKAKYIATGAFLMFSIFVAPIVVEWFKKVFLG